MYVCNSFPANLSPLASSGTYVNIDTSSCLCMHLFSGAASIYWGWDGGREETGSSVAPEASLLLVAMHLLLIKYFLMLCLGREDWYGSLWLLVCVGWAICQNLKLRPCKKACSTSWMRQLAREPCKLANRHVRTSPVKFPSASLKKRELSCIHTCSLGKLLAT